MKTKLLRKLRKEAYSNYRIEQVGTFVIVETMTITGMWVPISEKETIFLNKKICKADTIRLMTHFEMSYVDKAKKYCDILRQNRFHLICQEEIYKRRYKKKKQIKEVNKIIY